MWVGDLGLVYPISWLGVIGIINLGGWVDGRLEIFEKRTSLLRFIVNLDVIGVVWFDDQCVENRDLLVLWNRRTLKVLLLVFARSWVLVAEDEVNLVSCAF